MKDFPQIPGFEFHELLGRGGMANVFAATQTNLGRRVAIKVVARGADAQLLERFENEARALAGLQHPNIVELFDFGRTDQGELYYVMPLMPGGDLTLLPKPMAVDRLIPLLDSLLDALAQAHAAGIVHRDIKPENILFDRDGRPLLADFGAALMRARTRLTDHGSAIGSSGYMSPEQARGAEVDGRSDLYSVAVLGFEMLTGCLPFDGPDDLAIALAQCEQAVPRLPSALAHWQGFFDRALRVDPQKRFADAGEMRKALQTISESKPASAERPAMTHHLRWVAVGLAIGLSLAALWWSNRAPAISAESIAALISAGALTAPDDPNAVDGLVQARAQGLAEDRLRALQDRLLTVVGQDLQAALNSSDQQALTQARQRWSDAVSALGASSDAAVTAQNREFEQALTRQLQAALTDYDPDAAGPALAVLDDWPAAPEPLLVLAKRVRAMPAVGERFSDAGGPELILAKKPNGSGAGIAVMAAALQPELYNAFIQENRRSPSNCSGPSPNVQGCIDRQTGRALAEWLSQRTGHNYRIPTQEELAAVMAFVAPADAYGWTNSCKMVRVLKQPNVAQRTWTGVKRLVGRDNQSPRYYARCEGYLALALDGRGETARLLEGAGPEASLVLVRKVPANPI